ncbi:MAG: enoyl-CoA hydratase/isomerase family protein [Marinoscillum sp.]
MSKPYVSTKNLSNGNVEIEFFHPQHNSMPGDLLRYLADQITALGADESVNLIVLRSGGDRTFCAGASFDELVVIDDLQKGKEFFSGFAYVINACRKCPKLIVGRVQGKAVGGGVGLAAAVDYCFATTHASIKLSELNIGIGPFVISPAVERKIGLSAFSKISLNPNEFYSAAWAQQHGLFHKVTESTDEMDQEIQLFIDHLATTNPEARKQMKQVLWSGCDHWDELLTERAQLSGQLVLSDFTKKALSKYK